MGSLAALEKGSSERYFQQDVQDKLKFVPEGVEGRVPFKGSCTDVIFQLVGGLRASMGYTGNVNINSMQKNHITFLNSRVAPSEEREQRPLTPSPPPHPARSREGLAPLLGGWGGGEGGKLLSYSN